MTEKEKGNAGISKNYIYFILIALAFFALGFFAQNLFVGGAGSSQVMSKTEIGDKTLTYISENFLKPQGLEGEVAGVEEHDALYVVNLSIKGGGVTQNTTFFVTKNGELILVDRLIDLKEEAIVPIAVSNRGPEVGEAIFKGPEDARVTIIEYSSFTCPFCNMVRPTIEQIIETYPGQIRYVYKHFDRGGPDSKAGQAAECAREQGKFWEMHDLIFDNGANDLKRYAIDLGLDTELFNACFDSGKYADRIEKDTQEGISFGSRATPTFFINGQILIGAQPFSEFKAIIDTELEK